MGWFIVVEGVRIYVDPIAEPVRWLSGMPGRALEPAVYLVGPPGRIDADPLERISGAALVVIAVVVVTALSEAPARRSLAFVACAVPLSLVPLTMTTPHDRVLVLSTLGSCLAFGEVMAAALEPKRKSVLVRLGAQTLKLHDPQGWLRGPDNRLMRSSAEPFEVSDEVDTLDFKLRRHRATAAVGCAMSSGPKPEQPLRSHQEFELPREPTEPLCWLHLSDLHVGSDDWQQDVVLRALLRDLPGLLERADRKPRLLFITGDIANRGREEEYNGAFRFFDSLCQLLGIDRNRVFMVPGNHDVDRKAISKAVQRSEQLVLDSVDEDESGFRTVIDEIIGDADEMRRYGVRLAAWSKFVGDFLGTARGVLIDQPWRSDIVDIAGVRVGVASICTAWLSGENDTKGKLVVGERQIRRLITELSESAPQLRIALLHHPIAWLREAEAETIHDLLRAEFDVILHGHQHRSKGGTFVQGTRDTVEIGAGATYAGLGQDRYHGFQVAQLDIAAGQLVIDAFTWTTRNSGIWHLDAGFHPEAPQGRLTLPLRIARMDKGPVKAQPDALIGRLRRATLQVLSPQAFIGLPSAAPRLKATLRDTFVPVELHNREHEGHKLAVESLRDEWLAAEHPKRVVVLGDPGSGKSTLCRYLAIEALERESAAAPLLLAVRDWAATGAREGIFEFAGRHLEQHLSIRCELSALEAMAQEGRIVLLVDGFDETGAQERVRLRDRLRAFAADHPRVSIIVTSRITGYDDASVDGFEHYVLEPFDEERLRDFIRRWYAVAEPHDPSERLRRENELWAALQAEPRVMALASNPLLATLIALVHFHRAQLPGDRAKLYALCIELMIVTWPAACGRRLPELEGFAQLPMLEELALWMQSQRQDRHPHIRDPQGFLITGEQFEHKLGELLDKHREDLDVGRRRALANRWKHWLVRESGLIQEQRDNWFGYLHLSMMEYLAGQAALREHSRNGQAAIVQFVVEKHRKPLWRETLLLALGSRNDDRELGNAVVVGLLESERSWDTCVFLLSLLREEIEIDSGLRIRVLDLAAQSAINGTDVSRWEHRWNSAKTQLADILHFSGKHGPASRRWIEESMAQLRGEALVGALVILPDTIEPTETFVKRSDDDLMLFTILDLGSSHSWGHWAAKRATPITRWNWHRRMPPADIVFRLMAGIDQWGMWVTGLMRRSGWLSNMIQRGAATLSEHAHAGSGLPARILWDFGAAECAISTAPAIIVSTVGANKENAESMREGVPDLARQFAKVATQNIGPLKRSSFIFIFDTTINIGRLCTKMQPFVSDASPAAYFSPEFLQELAKGFFSSFSMLGPRGDKGIPVDDLKFLEHSLAWQKSAVARQTAKQDNQHNTITSPVHVSGRGSSLATPEWDLAKSAAEWTHFAEAHAGLVFTPSGEPAHLIAEARVQNRWINYFFDPLVDNTIRDSSLTPEQHAVFLALGLAQFQTTWLWPAGHYWHSWFTGSAPNYWLAAFVWHLCWAVGEPENPDHLARASACLDRGDDPELVAELRNYSVTRTSPEVLELFRGTDQHSSDVSKRS